MFSSPFYIFGISFFFITTIASTFHLLLLKEWALPSRNIRLFLSLIFITLTLSLITSSNFFHSLFIWTYFIAAICLFFASLQFSNKTQVTLQAIVFGMTCLNAGITIIQVISGNLPLGFIGNPEFNATCLTLGLIFGYQWKRLFKYSAPLLLISIFLTFNKATLLFLGTVMIYLLYIKRKKLALIAISITTLIGTVMILPLLIVSIKARLMIWFSALWIISKHPFMGIGLGQFGHGYTQALYNLFTKFPQLSEIFGRFSGQVDHAHNMFLQFGAEMGLLAFLLSLIGFIFILKTAHSQKLHIKLCLYFLCFKLLITPVFITPITAFIFIIIISSLLNKQHISPSLLNKIPLGILGCFLILTLCCYILSDMALATANADLQQRRHTEAKTDYKKALSYHPGSNHAQLMLAYIYFLENKVPFSNYYLNELNAMYQSQNTLKLTADIAFHSGQIEKAVQLYKEFSIRYPDHIEPHLQLAKCYEKQQNLVNARFHLKHVIAHTPKIISARVLFLKKEAQRILRHLE